MANTPPPPPTPSHILETILYVKSMPTSRAFYSDILNLKHDIAAPDMTTYPLGYTTLILFKLGGGHTTDRYPTHEDGKPRGIVPRQGPKGKILDFLTEKGNSDSEIEKATLGQHYALAVDSTSDVESWERHFEAINDRASKYGDKMDVKVLGTMNWERGGRSVYFEDPDGHVGEVGSRGIWKHY